MPKLSPFAVGTGNIQPNAVNKFFWPTDQYTITINNPSSGPNIVYYSGGSSNKFMTVYNDHGPSETYSVLMSSGLTIVGGLARMK